MRVLVVPNGSSTNGFSGPEHLVEDLRLSGLGSHTHARLLSNADVPATALVHNDSRFHHNVHNEWAVEYNSGPVSFTSRQAERLHHLISTHFPQWFVEHEATPALTATAVLDVARAWHADLIVIDPVDNEKSLRDLTSDDALEIATEAQCSVRIVREHHKHSDRPLNLLIGLDGSEECGKAVEAVSRREFSHNTKVYLLHVAEMSDVLSPLSLSMERTMAFHESGRAGWVRHMLSYFESQLDSHFRHIETHIRFGLPAVEMLEFAKEYEIDAILVGAHGLERTGGTTGDRSSGGADRSSVSILNNLGRVAAELTSNAEHIAVEIVRRPSRW